jgi:hypothetical protein
MPRGGGRVTDPHRGGDQSLIQPALVAQPQYFSNSSHGMALRHVTSRAPAASAKHGFVTTIRFVAAPRDAPRNGCPSAPESVPRCRRNPCPGHAGTRAQVRAEYALGRANVLQAGCLPNEGARCRVERGERGGIRMAQHRPLDVNEPAVGGRRRPAAGGERARRCHPERRSRRQVERAKRAVGLAREDTTVFVSERPELGLPAGRTSSLLRGRSVPRRGSRCDRGTRRPALRAVGSVRRHDDHDVARDNRVRDELGERDAPEAREWADEKWVVNRAVVGRIDLEGGSDRPGRVGSGVARRPIRSVGRARGAAVDPASAGWTGRRQQLHQLPLEKRGSRA